MATSYGQLPALARQPVTSGASYVSTISCGQAEVLKARQRIAQGKRRNASAALGNHSKTIQAL